VTALQGDRYLADDIARVKNMVFERDILAALGDDSLLPQLSQ
jgi:hypothetical protein